ncbi:MAG: zf-TFIIB domain-containing protein [Bacteriovoracaceae bacterium]|jgi:Zn-finger nucleic acid-binding protein|nr:zf-TFIIB domain-containing protein [Bacteriovoracaceae bacterium]|tara:strand:- start:307 stop:804 length:498 start_codon:yes stop_codon:yes gene_type:complete
MICPRCQKPNFTKKEYETVEIDQCQSCYGVWLDQGEIQQIIQNRVTNFTQDQIKNTISQAFKGVPQKETQTELQCPKCQTALKSINYTGDSGVIIDSCPNEHGVWLDKSELERVQQYREYWQDHIFDKQEHFTQLIDDLNKDDGKENKFYSLLYNLSIKISEKLF